LGSACQPFCFSKKFSPKKLYIIILITEQKNLRTFFLFSLRLHAPVRHDAATGHQTLYPHITPKRVMRSRPLGKIAGD
jgi:hypothetical protein